VAVSSRDERRARAVAAGIGAEALGVAFGVRDARSVAAGADAVHEAFGGLDVLVNNAGIGMRTVNPRFMTDPRPFWEVTDAGFRDVMDTKVTGTFLVSQAAVPRMLDAGAGRVVTISMSEPTMTRRGFVPYGPSGAAVEAFARVMAADLTGTPVTANILLPGARRLPGWCLTTSGGGSCGSGCWTRRSWVPRSCGWRPRPRQGFTMSGSSPAISPPGCARAGGTRDDRGRCCPGASRLARWA
jgi:NAD(P)-dependent dehydrogenase (short-subunit alcohol dehydrogenase family)